MRFVRVRIPRNAWRVLALGLGLSVFALVSAPGCGDPDRGTISLKGLDKNNLNAPGGGAPDGGAPSGPPVGGAGGVKGRGQVVQ